MIGYQFAYLKGLFWRNNQGGLFPLSPPFMLPEIDDFEARHVMSESGALFLRWESGFDQIRGGAWWHVIKDTPESLEELPKKTRYSIRKAAKEYEARPVARSEIIKDGYSVYQSAYKRYQTHEPMYCREKFCEALTNLPDVTEFWGVYEKESQKLVAFSENYIQAKTCFYVTMWLQPEAMSKFAGYLLFHEMELHYLKDRNFKYVSDGARSLSHDTNIHDFLIRKFNFRKAYARLHVIYVPWLGALIKLAYPFRDWIESIPLGPFKKASVLLRQEGIRRNSL